MAQKIKAHHLGHVDGEIDYEVEAPGVVAPGYFDEVQFEVPPDQKTVFFYAILVSYVVVVITTLVVNVVFAIVLVLGRKVFNERPFFRIVWQLIIANIMSAVCNLVTTLPVTALLDGAAGRGYSSSAFYKYFTNVDVLSAELVQLLTLVIAFHRLTVFMFPRWTHAIFAGRSLTLVLFVSWVLSILYTVLLAVFECYYSFDQYSKMYEHKCEGINNKFTVERIGTAIFVQNIAIPVLIFVCYCLITGSIYLQKRDSISESSVNEIEILKQAILIFIVFEVSSLFSIWSLSVQLELSMAYLIRRISNILNLLAGALTPIFFFVSSRDVRKYARKISPARIQLNFQLKSTTVTSIRSSGAELNSSGERVFSVSQKSLDRKNMNSDTN